MQRSGGFFKKAAEIVQSGAIGDVTFCRAWQAGNAKPEGFGNPADTTPPPDLDWEMWLGPAPKVPFNPNRWGVGVTTFPTFRYFWDYAGGAMTDWGIHLIDPMHQALGDPMPKAVLAAGDRFQLKDNTQTPDTLIATFHYEKFLSMYESRTFNSTPLLGQGAATAIHGTKGTVVVNRSGCWVTPTRGSDLVEAAYEKDEEMRQMNVPHWKNWMDCIKSRQKPISDIENCVGSSITCILANLSLRFKSRLDWDQANGTVLQQNIRQHLKARYRAPWKLEV
jgi:predicted dehydrogenase